VLDGLFLYYKHTSERILMKIRHIVIATTTALLLTTGNAWASNDYRPHHEKPHHEHHGKPSKGPKGGGHHKAPEIDAASGTSALALLTGVLLLAGERVRSRRA
jgi:hypothetical protein